MSEPAGEATRPGIDELLPDVRAVVESVAIDHHCPSVVWGLVVDGVLAHTGSTGALDDGIPPDEHTRYRIASMTKSFTPAAVLSVRQ